MATTIHAGTDGSDENITVTVVELPSGNRMTVELSTVKALSLVAELVSATNRVLENNR